MRLNGLFALLPLLPVLSKADDSEDYPLLARYPNFNLMQELVGELTRLTCKQTGGVCALEMIRPYAQTITEAGGSREYQRTDAEYLVDDGYAHRVCVH